MTILCAIENSLWILIGILFWRRRLQRRFPAFAIYVWLHVATTPLFMGLEYVNLFWLQKRSNLQYFFLFWSVYIVSAILLIYICREIFLSMTSDHPNLLKLCKIPFRWMTIVLVILSASSISYSPISILSLSVFSIHLQRSASMATLCLLAFLFQRMRSFRVSGRDVSFGIVLGMAVLSCADLVESFCLSTHTKLVDPFQFVYEIGILAGMFIWAIYLALPEHETSSVLSQAEGVDGTMAQLQQ
jgi:hypothetical protein